LIFSPDRLSFPEGHGLAESLGDPCLSSDPYQSFDLEWLAFQVYGNCKRIAFYQSLSDPRHYPHGRTPCSNLPFSQPFDFTYILENSELGTILLLSEA